MTTLREIGELALIRRLALLLAPSSDVVRGIGDDAAVVTVGGEDDLVLTSDAVVEGSHFDGRTPANSIGHKAVGRALSDIAAMGGEPAWGLIDLVAPGDTLVDRIDQAYRGAAAVAQRHGLALIGGDTTEGPVFELHVFVVGRVPRGCALLRSTARPGSSVFVTGALGGSLAGRHLAFEPRIREAAWLRTEAWAEAMIDVSDGLAADLRHVLEQSGVGAVLDVPRIPCSDAARNAGDGRSALDHALQDGEDFELLFTVPASRAGAFPAAWAGTFELPCTRIGEITPDADRLVLRDPAGRETLLPRGGYQHFASPAAGGAEGPRPPFPV